jgi:hypothetical protein
MIKIQEHFKKLSGQVNIFVNCLQSAFYVWKRVATPKVIKMLAALITQLL